MAPTSQKNRPIRVICDGAECDFIIRPEDLQWSEPSRLSVQQTLGGAWVDSFGPGIATITIAGHTGWRGSEGGPDWSAQFDRLHETAFKRWHERVEATRSPESVIMELIDVLDSRAVQVVPNTFVLKRNRSRPLLMQYHIAFTVIRDLGAPSTADEALSLPSPGVIPDMSPESAAQGSMQQWRQALKSLRDTLSKLNAFVRTAKAALSGNKGALITLINDIFGPDIGALIDDIIGIATTGMDLANQMMGKAAGLEGGKVGKSPNIFALSDNRSSHVDDIQHPDALPPDLNQSIMNTCRAGAAALHHLLANTQGMTSSERGLMMAAAAALHNGVCLFSNAFRNRKRYPDYDPLYGASYCSSTSGGRDLSPWRELNPFEQLLPIESPLVTQSIAAIHAAEALRQADPVLAPLPPVAVASYLQAIVNGTRFIEAG